MNANASSRAIAICWPSGGNGGPSVNRLEGYWGTNFSWARRILNAAGVFELAQQDADRRHLVVDRGEIRPPPSRWASCRAQPRSPFSVQKLAMPGGRLEVSLQPLETPGAGGLEAVAILVAQVAALVVQLHRSRDGTQSGRGIESRHPVHADKGGLGILETEPAIDLGADSEGRLRVELAVGVHPAVEALQRPQRLNAMTAAMHRLYRELLAEAGDWPLALGRLTSPTPKDSPATPRPQAPARPPISWGRSGAEVVRIHRAARRFLADQWYDEEDLIEAAVAASQRPPMRKGPLISAPTAYSNCCTGRRAAYRNTMPRTARITIDSAGFSGQIIQA